MPDSLKRYYENSSKVFFSTSWKTSCVQLTLIFSRINVYYYLSILSGNNIAKKASKCQYYTERLCVTHCNTISSHWSNSFHQKRLSLEIKLVQQKRNTVSKERGKERPKTIGIVTIFFTKYENQHSAFILVTEFEAFPSKQVHHSYTVCLATGFSI